MKLLKGMDLHSIFVNLFFIAELYFSNKCASFCPDKYNSEEGIYQYLLQLFTADRKHTGAENTTTHTT